MRTPWKATHYITTSDADDGRDIDVMLVDDNLYTEAEWTALAPDDEGGEWRVSRGEVLQRSNPVGARLRSYPA